MQLYLVHVELGKKMKRKTTTGMWSSSAVDIKLRVHLSTNMNIHLLQVIHHSVSIISSVS